MSTAAEHSGNSFAAENRPALKLVVLVGQNIGRRVNTEDQQRTPCQVRVTLARAAPKVAFGPAAKREADQRKAIVATRLRITLRRLHGGSELGRGCDGLEPARERRPKGDRRR